MRLALGYAAAAFALMAFVGPGPSAAQQTKGVQQKVTPPEARYWMGATTGGGMMAMMGMSGGGGFGIGDAMRMAASGPPSHSQSVELRLGTSLSAQGEPQAFHAFPPAAQVNQPIFLETPKPTAPGAPRGRSTWEEPKGKIKFYWGCGDKVAKGQPVVLDFAKLARGQIGDVDIPAGVDVNEVRKPLASNSTTYGDYPNTARQNQRLKAVFQPGASLTGAHKITGTYTPDIAFSVSKSFLEPVRYTATTKAATTGAVPLSWTGVARSTGYALAIIGGRETKRGGGEAEMVIWSSSEQPNTLLIHEDLAPTEVARLIKLKAVLPPTQTSCTIPAEVVSEIAKGGGEDPSGGAMLAFTAFGDQETFVHPPRPSDPKVTWDQEWFARVSYKSVRMDAFTGDGVMDMAAMMSGGPTARAGGAPETDAQYCARIAAERAQRPSAGQMVGEATGIPGAGMLGKALSKRRNQPEAPADPRCPPKR